MRTTVSARLGLASPWPRAHFGASVFPCVLSLLFIPFLLSAQDAEPSAYPEVTNVAQLQHFADTEPLRNCRIHLEGNVWWSNHAENRLVFHDDSGAESLEFDFRGQTVA